MRYSAAVSALALATVVLAQDPITIHVGNDGKGSPGLFFTPASVTARNGTVITFVFDTPKTNHTVAQSAFMTPCEPLPGGFDSGYTPGPANAGDPPATWNLTITNDAKPIWFYCAQEAKFPPHCPAGMVGAINAPEPPALNSFAAFQALAKAASVGQPTPALTGLGAFASAAPTVFVSSAASSSTTTSTTSASDSTSASESTSGSAGAASDSTATPSSTSAQAGSTDTAAAQSTSTSAPGTTSNGDAVTTTTSTASGTSSSAPASTSNAASVGAVGTNGLVWAVAAVFGVALI